MGKGSLQIMYYIVYIIVYACMFLIPAISVALIALRASGWKRLLAWCHFALLALPLVIAGGGGMILSARGLAWRSCVKLPCGFAYAAGLTLLLLRAALFLWRKTIRWRPAARGLGRCAVLAAGIFLGLVLSWYGLLFSAIWAGRDQVQTFEGQTVVAERSWTDWDLYAYHSLLVRGADRLDRYS